MWHKAAPLPINPEQKAVLEGWVRALNTPHSLVVRSKIILAAAEGRSNNRISKELGVTRPMVIRWRERFAEGGPAALEKIARGRGRKRSIGPERVAAIVEATLHTTPETATQWSCRTMAKAAGVSPDTVHRIWHDHGLQPHRVRSFKLSTDRRFMDKLIDVVGLYLNPPEKAIVLCLDEKSQIQALDRSQPGLPMVRGRCGTMTHDYKRNGTTTLFAALNLADGSVVGDCLPRHRHEEFLRFLRRLDREFPKPLQLHLILDNYATHKHPDVMKWLSRHKRFHLHFTPTSSSWLNLIESWFAQLTHNRLRRGVFPSVPTLVQAIQDYIEVNNRDPKPLVWTASVQDILDNLAKCLSISRTDH
jgi:transposase